MLTLRDVIRDLSTIRDRLVVCARRPWTPESEARLVALDENLAIPGDVRAEGLEYFLELHVAREVLEALDENAPTEKKAELLIFYAENDAYPAWVYE